MEHLVDCDLETLGWRLTDEEAGAIVFAATVYTRSIQNGYMPLGTASIFTVENALIAIREIVKDLESGSRILEHRVKLTVQDTMVRYIINLYFGAKGRLNRHRLIGEVCSALDIEPTLLESQARVLVELLDSSTNDLKVVF